MEMDTKDIRQAGVNLNYWWPVAHETTFPEHGEQAGIVGTKVGPTEVVVIKTENNTFHAYEDACPHKRVRLSRFGELVEDELVCTYHHWCFAQTSGECTSLSTMRGQAQQFNLKSYPTQTYGGWVWAFLGEPSLAESIPLPSILPAERMAQHTQAFYKVPMEGTVNCHFSYITENATDLFHAALHRAQQPWANPELLSLSETDRTVEAVYEVDSPNLLAKLFQNKAERQHVCVKYEYPYIHIYQKPKENGELGFYLFVTYLPTGPDHTAVFSTFYFPRIVKWQWLSDVLVPLVEPLLIPILNQGTFRKVFIEDIQAVEEEQRAYDLVGEDLGRETNPVSHAVRRVILGQTTGQSLLTKEPLSQRPGKPK